MEGKRAPNGDLPEELAPRKKRVNTGSEIDYQEHVETPSLDGLRALWDGFANDYSKYALPYTYVMGKNMAQTLHIWDASHQHVAESEKIRHDCAGNYPPLRVLELACGPGLLTKTVLGWMEARATAHGEPVGKIQHSSIKQALESKGVQRSLFVAGDLSPQMVAQCRQSLQISDEKSELSASPLAPSVDVGVVEINNCDLSQFPSASFDRVFSNLSLMLVPDHVSMAKESFRVLAPGGIAGFTVWGRRSHSKQFTMMQQAVRNVKARWAKEDGQEVEKKSDQAVTRSNFHLGQDDQALRAFFLRIGFSTVTLWHHSMIIEAVSGARFARWLLSFSARTRAMLGSFDESRQPNSAGVKPSEEITQELARLGDEAIASGMPIGLDAVVIVAAKGKKK